MTDDDRTTAELACARLLTRLAHHLDRRETEAVIALVTPDCLWRGKTDARGHDAIRARLQARPADVVTLHLVTNVVVDVLDERTAQASSSLCVYRFDTDGPAGPPAPMRLPSTIGTYHDRFVRDGAGWKIAERTLRVLAEAED